MFKLKNLLFVVLMFNLMSCSSSYVNRDKMVKNEFNDIVDSISTKNNVNKKSAKSDADDNFIKNSLIEFVMKSKLQKKVMKLNQKSEKEKSKKERRKAEEAGIGRFSDTISYKSANILSTDKCSLLFEKKIVIRKRLTICLKGQKMLPLLNKVYSFKKLLKLSKQCEIEHKLFIDSIRFYKSKKCYNEKYKKGKFISPLNLIK